MRAPQRAETITADSLTEIEYNGRNYLAAVFSDDTIHVLSFGGNGAIVESGELYITLPDSCEGVAEIERNWSDIPEDAVYASLVITSCSLDETQPTQIFLGLGIAVGGVIFRRNAMWETKTELINPSVDEFVRS